MCSSDLFQAGGRGQIPDYRTRAIVGKILIWWDCWIFVKGILRVFLGGGYLSTFRVIDNVPVLDVGTIEPKLIEYRHRLVCPVYFGAPR